MGRYTAIGAVLVGSAVLSGCVAPPPSQGRLLAEACRAELGVVGSYNYDGSDDVPTVVALPGNSVIVPGTPEEAARINACIRAKAAAGQTGGTTALPNVAGVPQRVQTTTSGTTTTQTFTYGTPPTTTAPARAARASTAARPSSSGCLDGGGPLQGGTGYCYGN